MIKQFWHFTHTILQVNKIYMLIKPWLLFYFLDIFLRSTFVGFVWSFGFFIPATTANDLWLSIPDVNHYIYFPILILEKKPWLLWVYLCSLSGIWHGWVEESYRSSIEIQWGSSGRVTPVIGYRLVVYRGPSRWKPDSLLAVYSEYLCTWSLEWSR